MSCPSGYVTCNLVLSIDGGPSVVICDQHIATIYHVRYDFPECYPFPLSLKYLSI